MPDTIYWQVLNLCCNDWVVYAAVPLEVDLISNTQVVEVGGKGRCYYLQTAANAVEPSYNEQSTILRAGTHCIKSYSMLYMSALSP